MVRTFTHRTPTRGDCHIVDLTPTVLACVDEAEMREGTATLFVPGSTGGLTTIEFEPGCVQDLEALFERIAPRDLEYAHELAWHDGNGHSHARAALLGPSLVLPIFDCRPVLGTWQQVILVDFDNKPRERTWTLTLMGE